MGAVRFGTGVVVAGAEVAGAAGVAGQAGVTLGPGVVVVSVLVVF